MKFPDFADAFKKKLEQIKEIKTGEWFPVLINRVLTEHARTVTAEFYRKKYPALDKQRIAQRLVKNAEHNAGLSGVAAASAITVAELAALESAGATLSIAAGSFVGEVSATTYIQLSMVYDIFEILQAPIDLKDPEDIMTMFWYAFGVNKYESIANLGLKAGPRTAEYLGRKALRSGIRRALQIVAARLGGRELARKITERALLKLVVPGVNLPVAYLANKLFTKSLGKKAIKQAKKRAAALGPLRLLTNEDRKHQLMALPVIYHIGISQENEAIAADVIEIQDIVARHLHIETHEEEDLERLIGLEYDKYLKTLRRIKRAVARPLFEIASVAHVLTLETDVSKARLKSLAGMLSIEFDQSRLKQIRTELEI